MVIMEANGTKINCYLHHGFCGVFRYLFDNTILESGFLTIFFSLFKGIEPVSDIEVIEVASVHIRHTSAHL